MTWQNPAVGNPTAITSPFGPRKLAGAISNFHAGTDIGSKRGNVYAAEAGTVRTIWQTAKGAWVLDIQHAGNVRTRYIHMYRNEIAVGVGQKVSAGQRLGNSGASGTSAAHLHFEVLVNGKNVDPEPFMRARGVRLGIGRVAEPTPTSPEEDDMRMILARLKTSNTVYLGNGITRRAVANPTELADIQWRMQVGQFKGDPAVQVVERIDWLGKLVK